MQMGTSTTWGLGRARSLGAWGLCSVAVCVAAGPLFAGCGGESAPAETAAGSGGMAATVTGSSSVSSSSSSSGSGNMLPSVFQVSGVVIDDNDQPVEKAIVMQAGRPESLLLTGADGRFSIEVQFAQNGIPAVSAAKLGYRAIGEEFFVVPTEELTMKLEEAFAPDNEAYVYEDPGDGVDNLKEDCSHCHTSFVKQFLGSGHADAAKDPKLHDLYAGVSRAFADQPSCEAAGGRWQKGLQPGSTTAVVDKCYVGGGVLPDLNADCGGLNQLACDDPQASNAPTAFGACADCHAPGINGVAGGRGIHEADGLAYKIGVHCDVCHKVKDIDLTQPPGIGQRLVLQRPSEPGVGIFKWTPIYFGPLPDVPNPLMRGSPQPKFNQAVFCAGCHEQEQQALVPGTQLDGQRWPTGVPVHSTFSEWEQGPYKTAGTPCQSCHMPATYGVVNSLDVATADKQSVTNGFLRPPEDVRQHTFRGPLQRVDGERLIDAALFVQVDMQATQSELEVQVNLSNVGCGHAVPTGEPMRSLVMFVEVDSKTCGKRRAVSGMTINDIGGSHASGTLGASLTLAQDKLTWATAAPLVKAGQVIRFVRPSGQYDDYLGAVGLFAGKTLSPEQKGMEIHVPVAEATVLSVNGGVITLDQAPNAQSGDTVYLGEPRAVGAADGEAVRALAGASGYTFARVMLASNGARQVPHYRAVDIASDNRIPPGKTATTTHSFSLDPSCSDATARVVVLYRPLPLQEAALRGWDAKDYLIAERSKTIALP